MADNAPQNDVIAAFRFCSAASASWPASRFLSWALTQFKRRATSQKPLAGGSILHTPHPLQRLPFSPDPSPQANNLPPMDIIFIDGFRGSTIIGICDDELHAPQPVRIDLAAGLPRSLACSTDRIGDTIDYGEVRGALRELLQGHRFQLLEAFAEAIANLLLTRFGAHWLRVAVTKPGKFDDVEGVGVIIERRRDPSEKPAP
ncbi:MAG TPA: dihydroneopterin aldolase, partial [Rhodocyclaceae bacterium]|nr:dihydroneopterin aldolase [Rhodocyclaceae bacterium]